MVFLIIFIIIIIWCIFNNISCSYLKHMKDKLNDENKSRCIECEEMATRIETQWDAYESYIKILGLTQTYHCSSSVVSSASNNHIKYLIKYSNLQDSMECLEQLEYCINFLELHSKFCEMIQSFGERISNEIPFFIKVFVGKKKRPYFICNIKWTLHKMKIYDFKFLYISPAGKSSLSYTIPITKYNMQLLRSEISAKINKKGHSKTQRSSMTNDLREAIKKRDNYTCCLCGNSVFNEPNLLLEVDHIIPISKGGKTEASNLQTLCWRCNRKKSNN